jgi:large subunit ribosomal protein L12
MEYVYSALLLHSANQEINLDNVKKVLESVGVAPDEAKIKALVASMEGVNIEEAIQQAAVAVAAPAAAAEGEAKQEEAAEEESGKKAEEAAAGLSALFG